MIVPFLLKAIAATEPDDCSNATEKSSRNSMKTEIKTTSRTFEPGAGFGIPEVYKPVRTYVESIFATRQ